MLLYNKAGNSDEKRKAVLATAFCAFFPVKSACLMFVSGIFALSIILFFRL